MRELGINVEETAIMSALTPCVAILMPPVAGIIADRIGNFKVITFECVNRITAAHNSNCIMNVFELFHNVAKFLTIINNAQNWDNIH